MPGKVIGLKVEYEDTVTLEGLAVQLAETMQAELLAQKDAEAFRTQAQAENTKAHRMAQVLLQLEERAKNPPARVRRMDPLAEYDLDMVRAEHATLKERAAELRKMAESYDQKASASRTKIASIRSQIKTKQAKAKNGSS